MFLGYAYLWKIDLLDSELDVKFCITCDFMAPIIDPIKSVTYMICT